MKAAVLRKIGEPLTIEELPRPRPGAGEVLLKVRACGIDGTDLKLLDGFGYTPDLPFIMGHEIAGEVAEAGAEVSGCAVGDRVAVYNFLICGACFYCRSFRDQLCLNLRGIVGVLGVPGGYAEYLCLPARQLIPLPDSLSWADGATCCDAGLTALHAVDRAKPRIGDSALVIGIGGVGSLVTQILSAAGIEVIAVDIDANKAAWARQQGAAHFLSAADGDLVAQARELTGGIGVDRVIDVVGLEATMRLGFASLRRAGRMVVVGYTPQHFPLPGKELAQDEKEIIGARAGRREDLRRCLRLAASGKLRSIVSRQLPLQRVNEALAELRAGLIGRIVLSYD